MKKIVMMAVIAVLIGFVGGWFLAANTTTHGTTTYTIKWSDSETATTYVEKY